MKTVFYIPDELTNKKRWVSRSGKRPLGKCNDPATWFSYEQARNYSRSKMLSGVSYALTDSDNISCIDLDNCLDDSGNFTNKVAKSVYSRFSDTFVEVSQSGTGLHIFCKGSASNIKAYDVEIYSHSKFIAVTGLSIGGNTITDYTDDLQTLYSWLVARRERHSRRECFHKKENCCPVRSSLSADAIIEKAINSRQGEKFKSLYNGDWQPLGIGDGSQSSADLSFCNSLAYWTDGDKGLMIEIFQSSGLFRNSRKMMLAIDKALSD